MRARRWILMLAVILCGIVSTEGHAQCAGATACSAIDCTSRNVLRAFNSINLEGTTLTIPSGACIWKGVVTFSNAHSYTIQGQTTVSGTCAPGGTCTPIDGTTITLTTAGAAVNINAIAGKSQRWAGLTFISTSGMPGYGKINVNGASTAFRLDHCHFDDRTNGDHTFNVDAVYGVFDHNYFDSSNSSDVFAIQPTINGPDGNANVSWTQPENFGTSQSLYIENNFFTRMWFAFDCNYGARFVFRYNMVSYGTRIQTHAVGSGAERRGCREMEVYGNSFQFSASPNGNCAWPQIGGQFNCGSTNWYFSMLVDYESGTGMWWGNTVTGFGSFLRSQEIRANNATYPQNPPPNGWGYCGTAYAGRGSAWDQNGNTTTGYACLDQIGRGAGDLITGAWPNKVNQTTGTIAWPHQAVVPTYAWNNTVNQVPNLYQVAYWGDYGPLPGGSRIAENRDYYLQLPNNNESAAFSGTAGIGEGTLAARPLTCTPLVGYWATDQGDWNNSGSGGQGQFYVCTAANTWTLYYTPYTYPHPLARGASPTPPSTPGAGALLLN